MKFYPVHLNISDMMCVVVGGGDVAERKVENLLECDGRVVVVARAITPKLETLKREGSIRHIPEDYRTDHIAGAFLVIGATDRDDVNGQVYRDAEERSMLVNIVDEPERCRFIVPSQVRQGDLLISLTTGGKSPALARRLRKELEGRYCREYQILVDIMGRLRGRILARGESSDCNKKIFESILDTDILERIREEDWDGVRDIISNLTGEDIGTLP